jgi:hypothetical protein
MHPAGHLVALFSLLTALQHGANATPEDSPQMQIVGNYRYLHHGLFLLYEATLAAPAGVKTTAILSAESPFELHFYFLRAIKKSTVLKSAKQMLERNLDSTELTAIHQQVAQLHAVYPNIEKGDRAILRYHPQTGTHFDFNEEACILLPGKDFAKYYFRIWLGLKPVSLRMRNALLGR